MTDSTGNPTAKLQTKTKGKQEVMKANVTTADVELMRKLMPGAAPEFEKWLHEQGNKVTDITSDLKGKDKKDKGESSYWEKETSTWPACKSLSSSGCSPPLSPPDVLGTGVGGQCWQF